MTSPNKFTKPATKNSTDADRAMAAKADQSKAAITAQRIDETGLTNRVRGHVSAAGKRAQGKKDSR